MTGYSVLGANLAFVVALLAGPPVVATLRRLQVIDHPGERSSHDRPTPRGGGVTIAAGALSAALVVAAFGGPSLIGVAAAAVAFGLIGLAEDVRGVPPGPRLALQFAAASVALLLLLDGMQGPLVWQVVFGAGCLFWLVAYTNAFNFMDGINGISVAQAMVAGVAWLVVGHAQGVTLLAGGGALIAAAAFGFLPFNFPNARMFLGDAGSYFLGAWLAALAIIGLRAGLPPEAVLAPLAVYLTDTSTTIVSRYRAGEVIYTAHRRHAYQRLVRLGWSHAATTVLVAAVMASCSALGALSLTGATGLRVAGDAAIAAVLTGYALSPEFVAAVRRRQRHTVPPTDPRAHRASRARPAGEPGPPAADAPRQPRRDRNAVPARAGQAR